MIYEQLFIDCIPGPTYHFGGHSYGNLASMKSAYQESNPKKMALEWLEKIEAVSATGAKQIILPSQPRPLYNFKKDFDLRKLSAAYVWMANSGHFTPSCDTKFNHPMFTPANMNKTIHRNKEYYFNRYWIKKILNIKPCKKLESADEGAANTIRLSNNNLNNGLNIYIHGNQKSEYPARQSKDSIYELIHQHQIKNFFILEQHKEAVDSGVFHNDVISFGFKNYLFCHVKSYENQTSCLNKLKSLYFNLFNQSLKIIEIDEISLDEAVKTYLFNSQVIMTKDRHYLLCPLDVRDNPKTFSIVTKWKRQNFFDNIFYVPLQLSLKNGGGPACMRLAIYLTKKEQEQIPFEFYTSKKKRENLKQLILETYPEDFEAALFKESLNTKNQA